jgi:hypothetical protein
MSKVLWTLRESRELPPMLWETFKSRATASGHSPTAAMARIVSRYLERGFDDGRPELGPHATAQPETAERQ